MRTDKNHGYSAVFLLAVFAALPACKRTGIGSAGAVAEMRDANGVVVGHATFEAVDGGVEIHFEGENLPPGPRGFHIHEVGDCTPPTFESAGDHFNPGQAEHGLQNPAGPHAGDLPNLEVADDGTVVLDAIAKGVTLDATGERSLLSGKGTALVIHAGRDDQRTDPSGGSGDPIACGVIRGRS